MFQKPRHIKSIFALFAAISFFLFVLIESLTLFLIYRQKRLDLRTTTIAHIESTGRQADLSMAALSSAYHNLSCSSEIIPFMNQPIGDRDIDYSSYFSAERLYFLQASDFSMISSSVSWSAMYYKDELQSFVARTDPAELTSIGLVTPRNPACQSVQLVFMGPVYDQLSSSSFVDPLGYLCFSIKPEAFISSLSNSEIAPIQYVLRDGNGQPYFFDKQLTAEQCQLYSDLLQKTAPKIENMQKSWLQEGSEYIYWYPIEGTDCTLYGITSAEYISPYIFRSFIILLFVFILFSAFIFVLFYIVFRQIVVPVKTLSQRIHTARKYGTSPVTFIAPVEGCMETRDLSEEFNKLITQNDALNASLLHSTETSYKLAVEKERAEMSHLRSQINPHFLYNTLESIRGMAMERGDQRVADISTSIGKMLRYSIKGSDIVLLKTEIELTKAYLQIQTTRFPEKFQTFFSMADDVENCYVCKLMLQPILENSIIHGFSHLTKGGILWVGGKKQDDTLVITIQDNGSGIPADTLADVQQLLNRETSVEADAHIGIANVHRRIQLHWGKKYGVSVFSQEDCGTRVVLTLPLITQLNESMPEEDFDNV